MIYIKLSALLLNSLHTVEQSIDSSLYVSTGQTVIKSRTMQYIKDTVYIESSSLHFQTCWSQLERSITRGETDIS